MAIGNKNLHPIPAVLLLLLLLLLLLNERAAEAQILGGGHPGPACRFYVGADERLLKKTLCLGNVLNTAAVGAITLGNRVIDRQSNTSICESSVSNYAIGNSKKN